MVVDTHTLLSARVLLADPHERFRAALRQYLHTFPGVRVVAEATSVAAAVAAAARSAPDVALLDLGLCIDTLLIHRLAQLDPRPRVVVASLANDPAYERRAMRLGADAWVVKDDLARIHSVLTIPGAA